MCSSDLYKDNPVYTTNISEATSFGAALLGKSALESVSLHDLNDYVDIEMIKIQSMNLRSIFTYVDSFLNKI